MAKKNKTSLAERLQDLMNNFVAKQIISEDFIHFERLDNMIVNQGTREALNRSNTVKTYVKVTHWFGVFWFYVNVRVLKGEDGITELPFVSVSFFQESGENFNQLFRAEWDNYEQKSHPQPHWHIISNNDVGFESLAESSALEDNPFLELEEDRQKVDIPKIHFAMAGSWHGREKEDMISSYTDEMQLSKWLINLFDHVREELFYAYRNSK